MIAGALLWSARALATVILGFWLFFIIAHLVGKEGDSVRPLQTGDYVSLAAMAASLVGLALALRWGRFGAIITLFAVAIGAVANCRTLLFPPVLIPIAATLFLGHWYLASNARRQAAAK
jgi:hypothetical protein